MKGRIKLKRFVKPLALWLVILAMAIFFLNIPVAISRTINSDLGDPYTSVQQVDRHKILSVLEDKVRDRKLLEKVKDKLDTLDDRRTRLIASLSDRIAHEEKTAGADIAFLLITILIILS